MPATLAQAVNFLETQWSSINANKVKGIVSEVRLKAFLAAQDTYYGPGGWIVTPGKPTAGAPIPTKNKVCLIPRARAFSWQPQNNSGLTLTPAELSAYNYFRQHGIRAYFSDPVNPVQANFALPKPRSGASRATYPRPYHLDLKEVDTSGQLTIVPRDVVFASFPHRNGNVGLRCNAVGRLNLASPPWNDPTIVSELFWFEYTRYFFQIDYLLSNNDLDMYVIGASGSAYPIELKSKQVASDSALGDWFGIDMGPFAKLAFFTANGMNTEALYVVEELDKNGRFVNWLAIRSYRNQGVGRWVWIFFVRQGVKWHLGHN